MNRELSLLSDLIEIKSYSKEEGPLANYIRDWFAARSVDTLMYRGNVIAKFAGRDQSRAFIMNSHMDTVDADATWKRDPFKADISGGKIYGLGSVDMKAGLAASMLLAEDMLHEGPIPTDMWFTYVVQEELDGQGSKDVADWFAQYHLPSYRETAAIFTEPTMLTDIQHGHRGNIFLEAVSEGGSGHASRPSELDSHSVRTMIKFADALQAAALEWRKEFNSTVFEPPTVGDMTSIQAGLSVDTSGRKPEVNPSSPNKFPATCTATFDVRTVPGFHEVALERVAEIAKRFSVVARAYCDPCPAGYTDPRDKIIRAAQSVIPNNKLTISQAAADLGFFTAKGIQAIIFGPGNMKMAHQPDEYCETDQYQRAPHLYKEIIEAWAQLHT